MTKKNDAFKEAQKKLDAELALPPEEKQKLSEYRREQERRLKELFYERRNGFLPPRPWYETEVSEEEVPKPRRGRNRRKTSTDE